MSVKDQLGILIDRVLEQDKQQYRGRIFRAALKGCSLKYKIKYRLAEIKEAGQRALKGYANYQIYNINTWFVVNITHLLHDLLLNLHSYPYGMTYDEWKAILAEMYECFRCNIDEKTNDFIIDFDCDKEKQKKLQQGLELFVKYFYQLWD